MLAAPQAVAAPGAREIGLLGLQHIAMSPSVREVLEGTAMFDLMGQLLEVTIPSGGREVSREMDLELANWE